MFFHELAQLGANWSVWLAVASVLVMLSLLVAIPWLRRPIGAGLLARTLMKGSTLKARLRIGFSLAAVVPVLTLMPLLAAINTETAQETQLPHLERLAATIAVSVPQLVQDQVTGIDSLAGHLAAAQQIDPTLLRDTLLRHHAANQAFASLWIARPNGDIAVATSIKDGKAVPWSGPVAGVAMMESFQRAVVANKLYFSSVQKGAAADAAPMMFISAPVTLNGDPRWGFVQGLLNLRTVVGGLISTGTGTDTDDSVSAVIVDQHNRVILTSPGMELASLSDLSGHPLLTAAATDDPGKPYSISAVLSDGGDIARYITVGKPLANGWRVFVAAAQTGVNTTLLIYSVLGLIWAFFAVVLARGLALLYGQVVSKPLQKLEASLDDFDAEHTMTMIPPPPTDAPLEIRHAYTRVRESMRSSRDAYRNMMKAVTEGAELRHQLSKAKGNGGFDADTANQPAAMPRPSGSPDLALAQASPAPDETWVGRLDSVTELSGLYVFEGFFSEAWTLGIADSRPMSIILVRFSATGDQTLKLMAQQLMTKVGRTLDLVARIAAWEFALILPDTNLDGAVAVAEKTREVLQDKDNGQSPAITFGVASIVPNANGNAQSFLDMCRRALAAADQKGDGHIAFVSDKGKITLHSRADSNSGSDSGDEDDFLIDWDPCDEASA